MSRTLSATLSTATSKTATRPVYLLRMGFASEVRAATWGSAITWNSESWIASGAEVDNLDKSGARLRFPIGESDPWMALILNEGTRGRSLQIYTHYTDATASPQADAELVFTGLMDEATITDSITVTAIESAENKGFPSGEIGPPNMNYLPESGTTIAWGTDTLVVE